MQNKDATASALIKYGLIIVGVALLGIFIVMFPAIKNELRYAFLRGSITSEVSITEEEGKITQVVAKDPQFSVVIPKIGANSKIIKDVDPYTKDEYLQALTTGVAHAEGTSYPGEGGNTFLFAHSSDNFYNANRYNSVFYLLNKMESGDEFYVVFEKEIYKYKVDEVKQVNSEAVEFLESEAEEDIVTLMTCWPPGTTLQRLLVIGKLVDN